MEKEHILQINTSDKTQLKRFVSLERKLLSANKHYISPVDKDLIKLFTGKNKLYEEVEFALFIARKEGQDIGRCAAIINRKYQRDKKEEVGAIGFFAGLAHHNKEIATLLAAAENWLLHKKITRIIAPWDTISPTDSLYILEEESPMFPIHWHPAYYYDYFLESGYMLKVERYDYTISFSSELYQAAKKKYSNPSDFQIRPITKKHWDRDLDLIRQLFNETFKEEWYSYDYTKAEFKEMFDPLKPIAEVNHFLIAEDGNTPIGFCFGMSDLSPMFRSYKGKFGLFQAIKILFQAKKYKQAGLLAIGVLPAYRGKGVSKALAIQLYNSYEKHGLREAFYYLVNDYNKGSRKFAESLGGTARTISYCLDKKLV